MPLQAIHKDPYALPVVVTPNTIGKVKLAVGNGIAIGFGGISGGAVAWSDNCRAHRNCPTSSHGHGRPRPGGNPGAGVNL